MARSVRGLAVLGTSAGITGVCALLALASTPHSAATSTVKGVSASAPSSTAAVSDQACDLKAVRTLPRNLSDKLRRDLATSGPTTADSSAPPMSRDQAIAAAVSNSSASAPTNLPAVAAQLPYRSASTLGGDERSGPALPDGTSLVAPSRCVWVVTVHGTFVPDSGPSNEARLAHTYDTYSVAYDKLSGTELWLSAGSSAPDLISGANLR